MVRQIATISFRDYDNRRDEIAKELFIAARDVGFFRIAGKAWHGAVHVHACKGIDATADRACKTSTRHCESS